MSHPGNSQRVFDTVRLVLDQAAGTREPTVGDTRAVVHEVVHPAEKHSGDRSPSGAVGAKALQAVHERGQSLVAVVEHGVADPIDAPRVGEVKRLGSSEGDLAALFAHAGLADIEEQTLTASAEYDGFEDWWVPFTLGVGPAGAYWQTLDSDQRTALRQVCAAMLGDPAGPFALEGRAWFARGVVPAKSDGLGYP
jgi:hypothetical protein